MMLDDVVICHTCRRHLGFPTTSSFHKDTSSTGCTVCLDFFHIQPKQIQSLLQEALIPYTNHYKFGPPSVAITGDVHLRYKLAAELSSKSYKSSLEVDEYLSQLKRHVRELVIECITRNYEMLPEIKDGCLEVHIVLALENSDASRPPQFVLSPLRKRRRSLCTQGGDPRLNAQTRLGASYCNAAEVQTLLDNTNPLLLKEWQSWFANTQQPSHKIHMAAWRRSMFIAGKYTKSRRDVSQTPFYVDQNGGKPVRLGMSSVQEQIAPALEAACRGISTANDTDKLRYGAVKFHASGREDMDVCMLLPTTKKHNVGGRPFCCQVVDACAVPTQDDLNEAAKKINHVADHVQSNDVDDKYDKMDDGSKQDATSDKVHLQPQDKSHLYHCRYGRNPMGVDVSSLSLTSSFSYRNLQADTEEKTKHYGCLVWCETGIASQEELQKILQLHNLPLTLKQQTPLRVLHRRTNTTRTRQVLSLEAEYVSEQYFRLHLSTTAGTYVKEFVHGDLGRTVPSIASMLGCKTDILELDCEGIAM